MRLALVVVSLSLCAGCPRYRDGFLGADVAEDGGAPGASGDARAADDDDDEHEGGDDDDGAR